MLSAQVSMPNASRAGTQADPPDAAAHAAAAPASPATTGHEPALHLVSLAAVTWDFALVGRTRMLTEAWRRLGADCIFVQVASLRTSLQRLHMLARGDAAARAAGIPIFRPWHACPSRLWPYISEKRLRRILRRQARELRRRLDRRIQWDRAAAVVVTPAWTPWLDELPFGRVIYDCIDALAVHVPRPQLTRLYQRWEDELLERASGAVVTAEALGVELLRRRADLPVATIRNGVDVEFFARCARLSPRPPDLPPRGGRPLVGFVGALYDWIDWELIVEVTAALPEFDFAFVGPHHGRGDVQRVARRPNVHLLGWRAYDAVPAYIQAFDICWVPFDRSSVSHAANPVKIYEYLALGKPVVCTPVADLDTFGALVRVGRTTGEIVAALRAAQAELSVQRGIGSGTGGGQAGAIEARVAFARANSWVARAAGYLAFLETLRR